MMIKLPNELLVEVWCNAHPPSVVHSGQVCKRFKAVIDSSTKLQLLIELYRSDASLAPPKFDINNKNGGKVNPASAVPTFGFHRLLQYQLQSRKRWDTFNPRLIRHLPPQSDLQSDYKLNNGYLVYCHQVGHIDVLVFRDIRNQDRNKVEKLGYRCIEFAFDLCQDLLITVHEAPQRKASFHILTASSGRPHPQATLTVLDDPLLVAQSSVTDGMNVNVMIKDSLVCATNERKDGSTLSVIVFDWRAGVVIFSLELESGNNAVLLSPTVLAMLRCSGFTTSTELWLVDLRHVNGERTLQTTILLFPTFFIPPDDTFYIQFISALFFSGSSSTAPDLYQVNERVGDTDVVTICLNTEKLYRTEREVEEEEDQVLLFISKKHLLQLAITDFGAHEQTGGDGDRNTMAYTTYPATRLPYQIWGQTGTRWLDPSNLSAFDSTSTYGSRFLCVADPRVFGLRTPRTQMDDSSDDADSSSDNSSESPAVILLEFNDRLWGRSATDPSVVNEQEEPDGVLAALEADVRGGMPFRVKKFEKPGAYRWDSVMMGRDHIVATLDGNLCRLRPKQPEDVSSHWY